MKGFKRKLKLILVTTVVLVTGTTYGQDYPNRPIRLVTASVGGGTDFAARLIAQGISGPLGKPVIVENRGDADAETVLIASPDGYTLLVAASGLWITPLLRKTPYDAVRDFSPITLTTRAPSILAVHPALPVRSVKELIALAKTRPGELNVATGTAGSSTHITAELFKFMAGVNIVGIPYNGTGPALNALISGETQMSFPAAGGVTAHLKSGRLRALAVTSAQASTLTPGLPTVAASLPGFVAGPTYGIFAPAKTPEAIIKRVNQEVVRVLNTADVKAKFSNIGVEVIGSSPEELAVFINSEIALMSKLIKNAGIRFQ